MNKIILIILILIYEIIFNDFALCNSSKFIIKEYPESSQVEPKTDTITAGVEYTISVDLDDCIKLALGNNPRIQSAMQDVFASDARLKQTWSAYFPQFSWQTGYSRIRQLQLSDVFRENLIYNFWVLGQISASQMLYDFGITQNKATIQKLDNKSYKIILTGIINEVVYDVKDAYYYLQYTIEAKRVAEETVKQYQVFYEQAKAFYLSGLKPKVDVTIAEVNLSNAKLSLIQAEHNVSVAMAKLNNKIGIPYYIKYNLSEKLQYNKCDINLDNAIEITQNSRPEFILAEVKVNQAKQNLKLSQKSWLPQLTIEGQFEVGGRHPDSNYGYTFGSYLNFPVINGMLLKHQIREANSLYLREKANAMNTKNNVLLEVQQAYYTLDEKKNKIPVAKLGVKQSKENYALSLGRYDAGIGDAVELKDAQLQYSNAQLTYYQIMYEFNSAKASLEKSMGKNIATNNVLN